MFFFWWMVIRWCDFKPGEELNWNWAKIMWNFYFGEKKLWEWWSCFTNDESDSFFFSSTRPEWKSFVECARAPKILLSRMENLEEEKCYVWVEEFFFLKIKLLWHFFIRWKAFLFCFFDSLSRLPNSFSRLSWWFDELTRAPLDTNSTVRSHYFSFLSVSLTVTHKFIRFRR